MKKLAILAAAAAFVSTSAQAGLTELSEGANPELHAVEEAMSIVTVPFHVGDILRTAFPTGAETVDNKLGIDSASGLVRDSQGRPINFGSL